MYLADLDLTLFVTGATESGECNFSPMRTMLGYNYRGSFDRALMFHCSK